MNVTFKFVLCTVIATFSSSCATYSPPKQGPVATMNFDFINSKGYVYIGTGPTCADRDLTFERSNVLTSAQSILWIQQGINTTGVPMSTTCEFRYTFMPRADAKYASEFSATSNYCTIKLFEILPDGEKVPVKDMQRQKILNGCMK